MTMAVMVVTRTEKMMTGTRIAGLSLIAATVGRPRTVAGKRSRHLIHTPVFLLTATFSTLDLRLIREIRETGDGGRTRTDNAFCPALSDGAVH